NSNHIEPRRFLEDASEIVLERVQCIMQRYDSIKINTIFNGEFVAGDKRANKSIATRNYELYRYTDLREWYVTRVVEPILTSLEEFQERDSGWALSRILNLVVNANKHNPLRAGCHIKLPREIMLKRAVINVQSTSKHVNLLYVEDDSAGHFALIKELFRLVRSQITRNKNRKYFCDRCLHYFNTNAKLETHNEDCEKINDCTIRLPSEDDKWLSFRNHCQKERVPFVVYADLECALEKTDSDSQYATHTYQHHNVFSVGYYVQCSYDSSLSGYRFRRDKDCIAWFTEELKNWAHSVHTTISANVPMADFTRDDWEKFNSASHCHVCEKSFAKDDTRVRDYCHLTGRYRGPAHSNCNLNYKDSRCIPVVFHNLSGYDAHFIIKEIATAYEGPVDLLPITKEKYISFTKHIDSTKIDQKNCAITFHRFI
ncbi:hypothetical protein ALC57_04454, partial [Trachymyrmex cornetzi]